MDALEPEGRGPSFLQVCACLSLTAQRQTNAALVGRDTVQDPNLQAGAVAHDTGADNSRPALFSSAAVSLVDLKRNGRANA